MPTTPTIQSYKKNHQTQSEYDTIIIGSGITAAAMLVKEGQSVLVLERHYTAGGFTHVFKRRGYEWDVGIHYIGEVGKPNSVIRKLFDYITDGKLQWADMGEVYDRVVIGDNKYDFVKGVQNFKDNLLQHFPAEEDAINGYVDLVFKATKTARNFFLEKVMPPLLSKVAGGFMRSKHLKYSNQTTDEVLRSLTNNEELIKVLSAQYGDYGLPPKQSAWTMHASVAKHYFQGGYFPVGGCTQIIDNIAPLLEQTNSTILISAEVNEILVENDTAIGVKMADGKTFRSKRVISGAGINVTYKKLLHKQLVAKHQLEKQLQKINPSVAHASLYIGLKGTPEELNLPKANYWIYPEKGSHDEIVEAYLKDQNKPFPLVYISFPSSKDPDWSNRYPRKSTIDIITLMPYDLVQKWEDSRWKKRGDEYDELKEKYAQRLLDHLYKLEPQVKGKIDYYELSTPLTTKHFMNYEKGELYGLDHSPARFRNKFLRPHTPIKNLFLTGQDIVSAGIGAALFSGLITASAILKKNLMNRIYED